MTVEVLKGPGNMCDFCNEALKDDYTAYNAYDGVWKTVKNISLVSVGAWHACPACALLIDTEDWDKLHTRCVEAVKRNNPQMSPAFVEEAVVSLHALFRREHTDRKTRAEEVSNGK